MEYINLINNIDAVLDVGEALDVDQEEVERQQRM